MAVIKICDSALVGGDDGAPLFDDNDEDSDFIDTPSYDLSVRIIYKFQLYLFLITYS